jgi:hypothetical protein
MSWDGSSTGLTTISRAVPAQGQITFFLNEFEYFKPYSSSFRGILPITSLRDGTMLSVTGPARSL